jgi:phosphopantothenoylcysteine decarboxylase/phosphopantothenate--cysteine ligase
MSRLRGRRIVVGVTGGIAAYKTCDLVSKLTQAGAQVRVVMTENAQRMVSALTMATLSGSPVITDMWDEHDDMAHISLADFAEVVIVAPATANIIGKLAGGIADDMLSTTLLTVDCPVAIAPAMNTRMWRSAAVRDNVAKLRERGVIIIEPEEGRLACGDVGAGRLPDTATLVEEIEQALGVTGPLAGRRVVVTAGPTREAIDPVRYLSNPSSGKMGYAIADAAARRGAEVVLVSGPTDLEPPTGTELVPVTTADEMNAAVEELAGQVDVFIGAAAVADWRPVQAAAQKLKKNDTARLSVELERTPDVIGEVAGWQPKPIVVGFAAETQELVANATEKLARKGWDLGVANDVSAEGVGFAGDTNRVTIIDASGETEDTGLVSKDEVAARVLDHIEQLLDR